MHVLLPLEPAAASASLGSKLPFAAICMNDRSGSSCPSQQFHRLTKLVTIHINISLRGADMRMPSKFRQ